MRWDEPAPTITTLCHNFGSGRFGHPEQDRAISLREAAILQSFPRDYAFVPEGTAVTVKSIGRWIGNAVPVELARAIARAIADDIREIA
jgi:DNA (cytosine-5)-methyltransferase 1